MNQEFLNSIARHLLTKFAGIIVAHGFMTGADIEPFIGVGLFVLGLAWSYVEKKRNSGNDGSGSGPLTPKLTALCLGAVLCLSAGCSTPQRAVYSSESGVVLTVDAAMTAWGHYVGEFHPPVEQEQAVAAAFGKYQTAMALAVDAARAWSSLGTNGPPTLDPSFQQAASDALGDLLALLTKFGVKL